MSGLGGGSAQPVIPKMEHPEEFEWKQCEEIKNFLINCKMYLLAQKQEFSDKRVMTTMVLGHLKGVAAMTMWEWKKQVSRTSTPAGFEVLDKWEDLQDVLMENFDGSTRSSTTLSSYRNGNRSCQLILHHVLYGYSSNGALQQPVTTGSLLPLSQGWCVGQASQAQPA